MLHPLKLSLLATLFGVVLLIAGCGDTPEPEQPDAADETTSAGTQSGKPTNWRLSMTKPEQMAFNEDETIYWHIATNVGDMKFRLFHDTAPMHVTSTIYLTEAGFYDSLSFHRVIPGFMAQGGDPIGNGTGNPGYKYDGEFTGGRSHDKPGILSMANAGPGTDGSQFFITFVPTQFLDGKHTIFGEIVDGAAILNELAARGSRSGATSEPLMIVSASISRE